MSDHLVQVVRRAQTERNSKQLAVQAGDTRTGKVITGIIYSQSGNLSFALPLPKGRGKNIGAFLSPASFA